MCQMAGNASRIKGRLAAGWVLLLSACAQAPERPNPVFAQAIEYNRQAQSAYRSGDYQSARAGFEKALQADISVENLDGIAINRLSLAQLHQAMGQPEEAQRQLDAMLSDKVLKFGTGHLTEATARKAALYLAQGKFDAAAGWADKADAWCAANCAQSGVILNLYAAIALRKNEVDVAANLAEHALARHRTTGNKAEAANSLRLLAQARMLHKEYEAALASLEEALEMDKALGQPARIREDLTLASEACKQLGRPQAAMAYAERAGRIR